MKYTNSYNISINITPFFDSGCTLSFLQMFEEIGGKLAYGQVELNIDLTQGAKDLITDQYTGHITLEKEGGNIYEVDFFITDKRYLGNKLSFDFVCVPNKDFFSIRKSTTWTNMQEAIESLYPGNVEFRECESDVNNEVEFYQHNETDYDFVSRLCSSFKHDIVYSFGFEGLLVKDTIGKDHEGNQEPHFIVWGDQEVEQIDDYNFKYDRVLYEDAYNPWEEQEVDNESLPDRTSLESKNCCSLMRYKTYSILGRDLYQAEQNRQFNLRYLNTNIFTDFRIIDLNLPLWKIGDVIYYARRRNTETEFPFDTFLVKSNEIFYAPDTSNYTDEFGNNFSWITRLVGLKQSGTDLNREDPTTEQEGGE